MQEEEQEEEQEQEQEEEQQQEEEVEREDEEDAVGLMDRLLVMSGSSCGSKVRQRR